eukprot:2629875-Pyramimonas_sp.AAC.1
MQGRASTMWLQVLTTPFRRGVIAAPPQEGAQATLVVLLSDACKKRLRQITPYALDDSARHTLGLRHIGRSGMTHQGNDVICSLLYGDGDFRAESRLQSSSW